MYVCLAIRLFLKKKKKKIIDLSIYLQVAVVDALILYGSS